MVSSNSLKVALLAVWSASCGSNTPSGGSGADAGTPTGASYSLTVAPIFGAKCDNCHWMGTPIGYQLQDPFDPNTGMVGRAGSWTAARHTINIVPGDPSQSFLVDKVTATDLNPDSEGAPMPYATDAVTATELAAIRTWIQNGTNNDADYQANVAPIFGDGVHLGPKAGKCSYCHTAKSLNPPNLVDPFDPARGVVNVKAIVGGTRVIPGDPDHSVLYQKVSGAPLAANLKSPMPYQTPRLTADEVAAIEAWITGGAKND